MPFVYTISILEKCRLTSRFEIIEVEFLLLSFPTILDLFRQIESSPTIANEIKGVFMIAVSSSTTQSSLFPILTPILMRAASRR
jgi:hypothetical protein